MALFDQGDPPPLFVPDLSKPAGAAVGADGTVTCIQCQAKVPLARADVVGQGYRCAPCSHRAEINALSGGPSDVGANLSLSDRRGMHSAGAAMMIPGVLMVIGGVILFGVLPGSRAAIYLLVGGLISAGAGLAKMNAVGDRRTVVCGDLNCTPWSRPFRTLARQLRPIASPLSWPAVLPMIPLDHILIAGDLHVVRSGLWRGPGVRRASDHVPVFAELERGQARGAVAA